MKKRHLLINSNFFVFVFLVILSTLAICVIYRYNSLPHDIVRKKISRQEAQGLVSFPICFPQYIPPHTDPSPEIVFQADDLDTPEERYIRLRYKQNDDGRLNFEIFQRFTNEKSLDLFEYDLENVNDQAAVSIFYWIASYKNINQEEIENGVQALTVTSKSFPTDRMVWRVFELTDPEKYHAFMVKWIENQVEVRLYSFLNLEQTKNVALSMLSCPDR